MLYRYGACIKWLHLQPVLPSCKRTNTRFPLPLNLILGLSLCLFLSLPLYTSAQSNLTLPPYRQYTLRDGLSQMQVMCMMQDSRGYLWVGTKAGLNCFNGEKFISYTTKSHPEIISDFFFEIREDSFGRIWASTHSGIVRIDGGLVTFFPMNSIPAASISPGKNGRIWFCQTNWPDAEYSIGYIENDSVYRPEIQLPAKIPYTSRKIHFYAPEEMLLMSTDSVLFGLKNNNFTEIDHCAGFLYLITQSVQRANYIKSSKSIEWGNNTLWDSELKKYEKGKTITLANIKDGKYSAITTVPDTIFYIQPVPQYRHALFTPDSVRFDFSYGIQLSAMIFDRDGHQWLGSEEGIHQLFDNGFTAYNKEMLPQVWAVTEDSKNNIWFSSYIKGFYKLTGNNLTYYPNYFSKDIGCPYFHPSLDKRGRLFFPNALGIVMVDGERFEQKSERLYLCTWYDADRDLLWGGASQRATVFDANRKIVRVIDKTQGLDVVNNVLTIGRDSSGYYWLGGGKGLTRYHWESNCLKNYLPGGKNQGAMTQCNDFKGRTWFGGKGGLFWYDAAADSVVRIDREELSDVVNMVGTIDSTWLIVSQPYGIYLMNLQKYYRSGEVELYLYNEKNGFLGEEPGQDGVFTDSKGYVWLTSGTHVVRLDPRKLKTVKHSLNIRIDKCNGLKLPFKAGDIKLPRNQSSAVITLDAICFNRPNPVQYSWKFSGEKEWSPWQEENYIVLSGLTDGRHLLEVKARVKGLPLDTPAMTTQMIGVRLAFYRQPWFFPVVFILLSLIGTGFLVFALTGMRKAGREARIFQVQAIQSQMNPHFIFNVLASLQTMILKADISKANDYLVKLADLVRGFLEASAGSGTIKNSKSNEGLVTLDSELKMLSEFVEFQQEIFPGRFEFRKDISGEVDIYRQKIPPMLIQPFVENAIRHGLLPSENRGTLSLRISKTADQLLITISDNGIGVEKSAELNRKSTLRYISRGKELTLKRISLLNKLGFRIEVLTDSNSNGTTITISMSL